MTRRRFTDSAGITCEYTPIEDLKPGDIVIVGFRTTVRRVEFSESGACARVVWEWEPSPTGESVDRWNPLGTLMPVEIKPSANGRKPPR